VARRFIETFEAGVPRDPARERLLTSKGRNDQPQCL
jgi:hypothetical protein